MLKFCNFLKDSFLGTIHRNNTNTKSIPILFVLATTLCFLTGCQKEEPQKTDFQQAYEDKINEEENTTGDGVDATDGEDVDTSVIYKDDSFVLFKDGRNNAVDDIDGYERTMVIPKKYNSSRFLRNHDFDFFPDNYAILDSDSFTYYMLNYNAYISEAEVVTGPYSIRFLAPTMLVRGDDSPYVTDRYDLIDDRYIDATYQIINSRGNAPYVFMVRHIDLQRDTQQNVIENMEKKDPLYYLNYMSNMFRFFNDSEYHIVEDDIYINFFVTCDILDESYKNDDLNHLSGETFGIACLTYDKSAKTVVITFVGMPRTDYSNEDFDYNGFTKEIFNDFSYVYKIKRQ